MLAFPCQHVFHFDCLVEMIKREASTRITIKINGMSRKELVEFCLEECFLCGNGMIKTIDLPFIGADEEDPYDLNCE